jgi:hypothetical protein
MVSVSKTCRFVGRLEAGGDLADTTGRFIGRREERRVFLARVDISRRTPSRLENELLFLHALSYRPPPQLEQRISAISDFGRHGCLL